jgi:DNA-binding PadR family transcriptional regulator
MQDKTLRKLFLGLIEIHILFHGARSPFYGAWMIEELRGHGYPMSAGTLYPILHRMEKEGLLLVDARTENGKVRKYHEATEKGREVLREAGTQIFQLADELRESFAR